MIRISLFVLLCLLFVRCHFSSVETKNYAPSDSVQGTTTTSRSFNVGSNGAFTSTSKTGLNTTQFKSSYKFTKDPTPNIYMGLQLNQGSTHFADTIRTDMFASLIDFAQVEMVRFDSITYKMDDNELMVRFILKLDRIPNAMPVVKESYTMVLPLI
jgi:hypothetical protein